MFSHSRTTGDLETVYQAAPPGFHLSADTVVPPGASPVCLTTIGALCTPNLAAVTFDSPPLAPDTTASPADVATIEAAHTQPPAAVIAEVFGPLPDVSSFRFGLRLEQFLLSAPALCDESPPAVATVAVLSRPPIPRLVFPAVTSPHGATHTAPRPAARAASLRDHAGDTKPEPVRLGRGQADPGAPIGVPGGCEALHHHLAKQGLAPLSRCTIRDTKLPHCLPLGATVALRF